MAYIVSNDANHTERPDGNSAIMHTVHSSAKYGAWDFEIAAKQMPDNSFIGDDHKYATKGRTRTGFRRSLGRDINGYVDVS